MNKRRMSMDINKYKMGNAKRTLENMARFISIALVVIAKYLQRIGANIQYHILCYSQSTTLESD